MSLTKVNLADVLRKQYSFKLKAYSGVFSSLLFSQLLALLFSFNGVGMRGTGSNDISISVHYYSADMVIVFTILWAFISAILITTKAYRNDDFAFVTNRLSNNLANGLFLLTASIIGGITAMLSGFLLKVIMYFVVNSHYSIGTNLVAPLLELLLGIGVTILYLFVFSALGYVVGTLVQLHRLFVIFLPALFFGSLFVGARRGEGGIVGLFYEFFFTEASFTFFLIKIIVTTGLLFVSAIMLSNRMEVRQ